MLMFQRSIYQSVIDDVIGGVRDLFVDECMDEQVLAELKQVRYPTSFITNTFSVSVFKINKKFKTGSVHQTEPDFLKTSFAVPK